MTASGGVSGRFDVAVIGSGFAGSILARALAARGRRVVLVERGSHPRFALGESSTPLAALSLERLAADYGLPDLAALAAAGRWGRELPGLRRGVKRGFTFYRQRRGEPFANSPRNDRRLLVAASPDEEVADDHWLRADVDAWLVERAVAEGVTYLDRTELTAAEAGAAGVLLAGTRVETAMAGSTPRAPAAGAVAGEPAAALGTAPGSPADGAPAGCAAGGAPARSAAEAEVRVRLQAGFVVDATGPAGFLARRLALQRRPAPLDTALLYGHFRGVGRFADAARAAGAALPAGPYVDDRAAVHHLLAEGWCYVLRFDALAGAAPLGDAPLDYDGLASVGFVVHRRAADELAGLPPAAAFGTLLDRYPTLAAQLASAEPVRPVARIERIAHRLAAAAGERWLLLPHAYAFFDPLYSTGIAWSLLGVERAAELLATGEPPGAAQLAAYGRTLALEADHLERLLAAAWAAMGDFRRFVACTQLYFAAASFAETRQRVHRRRPGGDAWCWEPYLGAGDEALAGAAAEALGRLRSSSPTDAADFERWIARAIAPRNVAGLADPARRNLYPADLETVVAAAGLLGAEPATIRAAMRSARAPGPPAGAPAAGGR